MQTGIDPAVKTHLAPVVDDRTRVLILGSLPGEASLAAQRYYAHPQNAFWRLVGDALSEDFATLPYEARLDRLRARGVGLWDVVASATREGSLDSAIRLSEAADLQGLIATLPALRCVGFNGATAAKIGSKSLGTWAERLAILRLPSSSPAFTQPFARKAEAWRALSAYL
ncbi:MAG: DNA-deoxyinosine glycosylase [Caulobacterales bacterium]|nr:DNA-deoxyinosine glycosylase [Caulobacterales bacterium]